MDSVFSDLHDVARARIIWGEDPQKVRAWLVTQGLTKEQSDALIEPYCNERAGEIRRAALKRIGLGLLLTVGGPGLVAISDISQKSGRTAVIIGILLLLVGPFLLVNGLLNFISGRFRGSITELE